MMRCIGRCYEHTPTFVDVLYRKFQPFIPPWRPLHVHLEILRGATPWLGKTGTILYAGSHSMADPFPKQFFIGEPQRERIEKIPIWALAKTLNRMQSSADLTIVFINWISARLFLRDDYLTIPNGVSLTCPIPKDSYQIGKSTGSAKDDCRLIRKQGMTHEISHRNEDFEDLYRQFYVPYLRARHGDSAIIRTRYFLRRGFRRGGLLWVLYNGQRVAGAVFEIRRKTLHFLALGQGQTAPSGAVSACYYFSLHHAHASGCTKMDFGGCASSPADGLFRYKLKWGSLLDPSYTSPYRFLLRWTAFDDCMADFFFRVPVFFCDGGDRLSAMASVPDQAAKTPETVRNLQKLLAVPGLHRAYIVSPSGWDFDSGSLAPQVHDPGPVNDSSMVFCNPEEFAEKTGIKSWAHGHSTDMSGTL